MFFIKTKILPAGKPKSGWFIASLASLFVVLSACSTLEPVPNNDAQAAADTQEPPGQSSSEAMPAPGQNEGLTADLLYDLLLSNLAFQEGELEIAAQALIRAARQTDDSIVIARAVRMAVHNKSYAEAVELGQRWVRMEPQNYQAGIITSLAAVMNQQPGIAEGLLNAILEVSGDSMGLRFGQIGETFLQYAEGRTAQDVLSNVANKYPESSEAWLIFAGMAQKNRDFPAMELALDRLLSLEPGSEKAAAYKLLALAGDQAAQTAFSMQFLKDYPDANEFRLQYARLLLRLNDEPAALDQLLVLLEHKPKNAETLNLVALLYQAREDYERASGYFALKLKEVPGDDRSRLYLAHALQELERYDDAKVRLAEIRDPSQKFAAERQMSRLIEQADGVEPALIYLQNLSSESEAQLTQLIIDRELMLQRADRFDEAYALINQTLEQHPDNDTLRYHRALILVEREDFEGHEADMRVLLLRRPENAHYNNTLGYSLLIMSDRLDEATELINTAFELQAQDPYILDSKGWLEYKLGNLDSALVYLHDAYSLDQDAEIAAHIGEVYWMQGDQKKAREFWQKGDTIDADNKALQNTKARFLDLELN